MGVTASTRIQFVAMVVLSTGVGIGDPAHAYPFGAIMGAQQRQMMERNAEENAEPYREPPRIGDSAQIDVIAGQPAEIPIHLGDWGRVAFTLISSIPDFTIAPDRKSIVGVPTAPPGTVYELDLVGRWPGGAVVTASRRAYVTVRSVAE